MIIYDYLLRLLALLTPLMVVLAFPLSLDLVRALSTIVHRIDDSESVDRQLRLVISRSAVLSIPFIFGMGGATLLTVNSERANWITNGFVLHTYLLIGITLLAVLPIIRDALQSLLSGHDKNVRLLGLWLGLIWAFLYASLGLQFYSHLLSPIR